MFALHYHDATKHHFNRFARSPGRLDWATQPDPFRRYPGAPLIELARAPLAADVPFGALYTASVDSLPITDHSVAEFLRCAMGLSAWKQFGTSRWALRVNPSSGNLHPTEAYIVRDGRVCHYAPREHALEQRCTLNPNDWTAFTGGRRGFIVALTSIHWREAWKYGERAFRYCQHDVGHAIGALRFSAAMLGWNLRLLPAWDEAQVAALLGVDRDADFVGAEREEPECLAVVAPGDPAEWDAVTPSRLVDAAGAALWSGSANVLSRGHVEWPIIDEVAASTRGPAGAGTPVAAPAHPKGAGMPGSAPLARDIILQRRSAVAFDGRSSMPRDRFLAMLARLQPGAPPWDALTWRPQVHLALFVHRVDGLTPGIYACLRDGDVRAGWQAAMRPEFLWEQVAEQLFLLVPTDVRWAGTRVSCDQDIAGDGFFSLAMIARFEPALREHGEPFYRRLFWECGLIGQVLYLEAEAANARSTGIGCFYDDAVHDVLGISEHAWQSLYHFSMGVPVEDTRLTTEPGYGWESRTVE